MKECNNSIVKKVNNQKRKQNDDDDNNEEEIIDTSTSAIDWNKMVTKRKKINFQQGIYTIPNLGKDVCLEEYYNRTVEKLGDKLNVFTISKEPHKSKENNYHIHWYLKYNKRETLYPTTLDDKLGKHGNLRIGKKGNTKKNQVNMVRYVIKGGEYLDYPEDWDSLSFVNSNKKGPNKMDKIANNIMEGKYKNRLDVAKDGNGGAAIIYGKHIDEFINMVEDENEHERTINIQWIELKPTMKWGKEWCQIIIWLNFYIRKPENVKGKIKHLYIHGERNLGKTTRLLDPLKERLNIYYISKDSVQNLPWRNNFYDLCILDDYEGSKDITWMNEFLGSKNMNIRIPGGTHSKKREIVPTIIISNITLKESYKKHIDTFGCDERYLALEDRFKMIHLKERGNPFNINEEDQQIKEDFENQFNNPQLQCNNNNNDDIN